MATHDLTVSRRRMVAEQLIPRGISDPKVIAAMEKVPRHEFVDPGMRDQAYGDYPLSIGLGQTISQPYIVALMTQSLKLQGGEKILEIGTGCGYQTSILAEIAGQVYTIERIKGLGLMARNTLKKLGYRRVVMRVGDGTMGWDDAKPFDAILIAAGAPKIPFHLLDQLNDGGKLVLPVGDENSQNLLRITKKEGKNVGSASSNYEIEDLGPCRFVKLIGKHGWKREGYAH